MRLKIKKAVKTLSARDRKSQAESVLFFQS